MPMISSPSDYNCVECDEPGGERTITRAMQNVTVIVAIGNVAGFEFGLCPSCRRQFAAQLLVHDEPREAHDEVPR